MHGQFLAVPPIKLELLVADHEAKVLPYKLKTKSPVEKQFPAEMATPQTQVTPRHYACVLQHVCNVCCAQPIPVIWFKFGSSLTLNC